MSSDKDFHRKLVRRISVLLRDDRVVGKDAKGLIFLCLILLEKMDIFSIPVGGKDHHEILPSLMIYARRQICSFDPEPDRVCLVLSIDAIS